ncbi:ATP-dependent DNA helicase RecQ2 [Flavobacterium psychrophilum]|uniref:RecQ family ATP-dependent DNA helicase n=1 Tax=Flavobacterium psychrophilum TaxID=96345 RepID=UPI00073E41E9|nr:ATP-dependent DNA helicase RecQ [Flavobacterium psychrophilum]SNB07570.1 ATP-dependent DNA helicase RecQ2 [Flavobacterium psychrophilum]SNB97222.1 ATP-dependent DNA helicase RecQ2 [Flavobacterium psychrophilum]GAQ49371.1 ATP-dependent DNA helicase RecQ2 [Flavobacterium psychrophilum]GAW89942.1 ATP-dependent DNA helicase RecQ2 [Flavobacterium psychrophilum]GEJ32201.1 ATP-dependent DNA helicase RecQ2 [Flavobacterium psychrophilum]
MQRALQILQKHWHYDSFRPVQDTIIQSVLEGNDTFGLMPTGGGKSLCFQVPAMVNDGLCLVISPLVALMKDQVNQLQARNIKAIALTGAIKANELINLLDNCQFGNYKFLYLSPERLEQDWVLERIKALPISLIAIDEAHCVSQWGHDFRPSYLKIKNLKSHFNKTPFVALTASATPQVKDDIIALLGLENPKVFQQSFARDNLGYFIIPAEDKIYKLHQILQKNPESAIIYVRNRKNCHEYASHLSVLGHKTTFYHAGLSVKEKEANMNSWMRDEKNVMIATSAFGMGIDKPNVKTVIHINLPENLESYYQEAGRAGRNGEKAFAVLISSPSDIIMAESQFIAVLPDTVFLKNVFVKLCNYLRIAYGEGINEEFSFNLNQFCSYYKLPTLKTYNALQFLDRQSIISLSQEFSEKAQVQFLIESKEVIRYISLNRDDEPIVSIILRTYPGIFDLQTNINTDFIAKKSNATEAKVLNLLEKLQKLQIVAYFSQKNESKITFLEVREDDRTINRVSRHLEKQNLVKKQQLQSVVNYVSNKDTCKSKLLLQYFGETATKDCGVCSYCSNKKKATHNREEIRAKMIRLLTKNPMNSRALTAMLSVEESEILKILQQLLEHNIISINTKNEYIIR